MRVDQYGEPEIVGWLSTLRNILIEGRKTPHTEQDLETVMGLVPDVEVEGTRRILKFCLEQALTECQAGRLKSAGWILNLVHNLPVNADSRSWDVDFFLKGWLPSFLEHYDEVPCARAIALRVCSEVAASPELSEGKWR